MSEIELQKEYKSLLASINPLVYQLKDPRDATHCLLWLTKLEEATVKERTLRNQLLAQLLENVVKKRLEYPFTEDPFDGPLQDVFDSNQTRTTYDSIDPNPSVYDNSMDSGVSKYRHRAKQHKKTISHYQGVMKTMLQSQPKASVFEVPPLKLDITSSCQCDDKAVQVKNPDQSTSLLLRIKNLESKTQDLEIKCSNVESKAKKKKNRSGSMHKYKEQIQRLVNEKDNTITKLKEEINRQMSLDTKSHFEDIYRGKFDELEQKYRRIVQDMADAHSKDRERDSKTIEALQKQIAGLSR